MAGERLAKMTIRASWSYDDDDRGAQTTEVRLRLAGAWVAFRRGADPTRNEFEVPDPDDQDVQRNYMMLGVTNLVKLIRQVITQRGLSYSVSEPRDIGDDPSTGWAVVDFDITAQQYVTLYDLAFLNLGSYGGTPNGWQVRENLATIIPLTAFMSVSNAGVWGTATGSARLNVMLSNGEPLTYRWADDLTLTSPDRSKLKAGTYRGTATDKQGASITLVAVVGSDPRLVVQVNATDTTVELVASGGVPGYTYVWADGPTTAARTGMVAGKYYCLVADSHGAQVQVEVAFSAYQYYWSQNAITLALDAGDDYRLDPTTKPNLSFLCEVWLEKAYLSGTFEQIGITLEQPADRAGRTVFQVQALLAAFLQHHVPPVGATGVLRADPLFRRFFLQHAEKYGDEPVAADATSLGRGFVVLGGLSFYEAQARTWFTSYQPDVKPFLTWEPTTKRVLADQPEFLYYMVQDAPEAFDYQVRLKLSDGSQQLLRRAGATGVFNNEVYCLPVGYQALELATLVPAGLRLDWWEIFVTKLDGTTVLSETRRFVLDARTYPHRRYLLFATSLGGMATYAALGETQTDVEVSGEEATLTLAPAYDVLAGDTAVQARALRPVVKLAAGKRTQAQLRASTDLLLSRRVLLLAGPRWLPGFVKAKTVNLLDESKLVPTQELEFYLTTERLYTPTL